MKKKNEIPKYYVFSPKKSMKTICGQSINKRSHNSVKILKKKTKILMNMISKKSFNLVGYLRKKTRRDQAKKRSKTLLSTC